jgi:hypothetical protein
VAGPCAVEGEAERGRRKTRRREGKRIMAVSERKRGMEHGRGSRWCQWLSCSRCQVPAPVDNKPTLHLARAGGPDPCLLQSRGVRLEWPQACMRPGTRVPSCSAQCFTLSPTISNCVTVG